MDHIKIRAPSLKRGKNDERLTDRIKLKKVLGLTVCSNAGLDVSPTTGILAYPAGCTVVLFNSKKLSQSYLLNTSRKAITAVAYSQCGRYLATGECGMNPSVKVWDLETANGNYENGTGGNIVAEFSGHKYAVNCVAFSPTGKYLVSVGSQHDNIVNVFDWKSNLKIASNKVTAKVVAVSFSEDGNYFVTVGNRHVKYWYLEGSRKYKEPIPLMGRSAILGELRNNDFCAVACGKGTVADSTYAITRNGHLVEFNSRRLLDKWVMCRTTSANCMVASSKYIFVGCADSIIRCFNTETLEYVTTLPRTHFLGVDVAQGVHINHVMQTPQNAKYPDTIAIVYDETRCKVTCVYNDHSLYIWDLRDICRIGKSHSFLYHSACIWGVETVPFNYIKNNLKHNLPSDCFLTCSSDDTIRVWDIENNNYENENEVYRRNIYSKELLKVLYIDDELNYIKDMDNPILSNNEKASTTSYDGRNGVRCIKINHENNHLATGDRSGNIRIYNLLNLKLLTTIEAHDSEVLCLEYSSEKIQRKLLASASRDRLIHVFDVEQNYRILQTLDDHSSSITSVKFIGTDLNFQMVSCGADKSIIFRNFQNQQFLRGNNCSGKNTLYDMDVDNNCKHILTACQDRNIRVYGTQTAKHTKTFKGSHSDEGSLIKLCLDSSGIYIATSCTDKTLSVYDYYSNECMARMYGHSELVTGLKFTNDCKYLISASGDGCVFVWQVPHDMMITMQARLSQQAIRSGQQLQIPRPLGKADVLNPFSNTITINNNHNLEDKFETSPSIFYDEVPVTPGYKFSDVGQLPQWAKRKPNEENNQASSPPQLSSSPNSQILNNNQKPRGRWATKQMDTEILDLRSIVESPPATMQPFNVPNGNNNTNNNNSITSNNNNANNTPTSGYNSGSSKDVYSNAYLSEDSSIDSGRENRRELIFLNKKLSEQKNMNSLNSESNTEHDGDVEDISDGERTSSDHGMVYYPTQAPSTPTDFTVNAMNVEELRKSVRRQKLEKQGLSLSVIAISAPSTGTGTGTSDDEDDGSTPSGDNADRSLASTLGGSSESIPHQNSSTFLQAALDGPGSLSDKERGRKSLSTIHNNDSKVTSISKSFANNKKEELMKVINEAKQKLENDILNLISHKSDEKRYTNKFLKVGYRSNLRASQSISDLSHSGNIDTNLRINRTQRLGEQYYNYPKYNYLNCAAPKSKLIQNCNFISQLQNNYPPYPYDCGNYSGTAADTTAPSATDSVQSSTATGTTDKCGIDLEPGGGGLGLSTLNVPLDKLKKHPSILKNYKSCPVSPVNEEIEWDNSLLPLSTMSTMTKYRSGGSAGSGRGGGGGGGSHSRDPKRHSMYSEDAKTILSMIHSDTEKMIAEITSKYGDLDDFNKQSKVPTDKLKNVAQSSASANASANDKIEVINKNLDDLKCTARKEDTAEHGFLSEEDGNFSSDSLEDCSLDLDIKKSDNNKTTNRKSCRKHHRNKDAIATKLPKRSVSDYFIYEDSYYVNPYRKVSLSDILNEDDNSPNAKENLFLETQRHSSASFFLGQQYPDRKSKESILSDDFSGGDGGISFCNSMESILSDESDCKSAPLEILFGRGKHRDYQQRYSTAASVDAHSKSYGSSPNATNGFDYFMMQQEHHFEQDRSDIAAYGIDTVDYRNSKMMECKSPTHPKKMSIPTSLTYPRLTQPGSFDFGCGTPSDQTNDTDEFIPSLNSKVAQYSTGVSKSLSKDFANQRKQMNSNPMYTCENNELFVHKPISIPSTNPFIRTDIFTETTSTTTSVYVMKKSCSFEIEMGGIVGASGRRVMSRSKKFEQNLQRFEQERENVNQNRNYGTGGGDTGGGGGTALEMDYVPHKPPVAHKRSASMKGRRRVRSKERYYTVSQINFAKNDVTRDFVNKDFLKAKNDEDSLDGYGGGDDGGGGDEKSFEIYVAEKGVNEDDNMDSLEMNYKTNLYKDNSVDSLDDIPSKSEVDKIVNSKFITSAEYMKFRDIEKKIDVINKLVEMEEKKLEQERVLKENRMKPFQCDSSQKGYVKNLTKNFDKLAQAANDEWDAERRKWQTSTKMKRNYSLPDVLEGAKFQSFCFFDDLLFGDHKYEDETSEKENYNCQLDEGNKNLLSVQDDDSSIRRACSLSDLSMGKGYKSNSGPGYNKPNSAPRSAVGQSRNVPKRSSSSVGKNGTMSSSGMGLRSISVGVLNQASDSDAEPSMRGGVLRPTISSQNKANGGTNTTQKYVNPRSAAGIISRRKGLQSSYSSVNIASVGQDESSSEESPPNTVILTGKPAVPPRPRSIGLDSNKRIMNVNAALNMKKSMSENIIDLPVKDNANDEENSTSQMCSNIINQLIQTTNSVIQLHQKLKTNDEISGGTNNGRSNNLMLKELENAVIMTQTMLTKITNNRNNSDTTSNNSIIYINSSHDKSIQGNGEFVQMMDKCSDLLNKVQHVNTA